MSKIITAGSASTDPLEARIGGGALIGGIINWPVTPDKAPLTLLLSLPTDWLNAHAGVQLPEGHVVSVFSTYSTSDYFLDCITYHGNAAELSQIEKGYTRVVFHRPGSLEQQGSAIPAHAIVLGGDGEQGQHSKVGGYPAFLQQEDIDFAGENFVLQIYGAVFPKPFDDVLYMSDAFGYLYVKNDLQPDGTDGQAGHFFAQVT